MANTCDRCNRELKDSTAQYGWRCAQILGVAQQLNNANDRQWNAFIDGAGRARENLLNPMVDRSKVNFPAYHDAMIRSALHLSEDKPDEAAKMIKMAWDAMDGRGKHADFNAEYDSRSLAGMLTRDDKVTMADKGKFKFVAPFVPPKKDKEEEKNILDTAKDLVPWGLLKFIPAVWLARMLTGCSDNNDGTNPPAPTPPRQPRVG